MCFTRLFCSGARFCTIYASLGSPECFQAHQWKLHLSSLCFLCFGPEKSLNLSHPFFHWLTLPLCYLGYCSCDRGVSQALRDIDPLCVLFYCFTILPKPSHSYRPDPTLGISYSPAWMGWDFTRPCLTSKRPQPNKKASLMQAGLECLVCPQEGSGKKASSQPANEPLLERRLNPPCQAGDIREAKLPRRKLK